MKYFIPLLLTISIIGLTIFGFLMFDMVENHVSTGCMASEINGSVCPMNISNYAFHHLSALQTLTNTLVAPVNSSLSLLLSLLFASLSTLLLYKVLIYPTKKSFLDRLKNFEFALSYSKQKIISWLSLFELSPVF